MEEIIKGENRAHEKYEEVLIRRDNLKKEASRYHHEFIRVFGDYITESFRLKIECIKKKKMIAYCQKLENQGKKILSSSLESFIEKEMADYQAELDAMILDVNAARSAKSITPTDLKKIKEIYYGLVKLLHPDLHPELAEDETIKDYWKKIEIAYRHNHLDDIQELDIVVRRYLARRGYDNLDIEVEDVEQKIKRVEDEITEIITTNPYLYKILLNDERSVKEKTIEYKDEIESYKTYSERLDEILARFNIEEMYS